MIDSTTYIAWSLVVAANSEELLKANLFRSGEVNLAKDIWVERNAPNASVAYNTGLANCTGDVVVFAHQDVFLPDGWSKKMCKSIIELSKFDPFWGALGVYGVSGSGYSVGYVYSSGLKRFVGRPISDPLCVNSLDEMILILRKDAGIEFDERLPGFHLYGTDICLEAETRGLNNYVLPCFAFHNSVGIKWLPISFWMAYKYLRRKWRKRLPVVTPCTEITAGCYPVLRHILTNGWSILRGEKGTGSRVPDPEKFYNEYIVSALCD
jgi:glycosyltransferase involved in cell wall biosynthesis